MKEGSLLVEVLLLKIHLRQISSLDEYPISLRFLYIENTLSRLDKVYMLRLRKWMSTLTI